MSIAESLREVVGNRVPVVSLRRLVTTAALALAGSLLVLASTVLAYGFSQGDRIYPGVRIGTVDVGGLTTAEARTKLAAAFTQVENDAFVLRFEGHEIVLPVADLHPQWDYDAAVARAHGIGRSGNLWRDSGAWLRARLFGERLSVPVTFDQQPIEAALTRVATVATTPPVDAAFALDSDGSIRIVPERNGLGIDLSFVLAEVQRRLAMGQAGVSEIPPVTLEPVIRAADLEPLRSEVTRLVAAPVTLSVGDEARWSIQPHDLVTLLSVQRTPQGLVVQLDRGKVEQYLAQIADLVVTPSHDARVHWDGQRFAVVPAEPGAVLDVPATVERLLQLVSRGVRVVPVEVRPAEPTVTTEMAEEARRVAERIVERGLVVRWGEEQKRLTGSDLARLLAFQPERRGEAVVALRVTLDHEAAGAFLESVATQVRQEPRDAVLRYLNGRVTVVTPEQVGRELDVTQSLERLQRALETGASEVQLVVREIQPTMSSATASRIVIRERISSGATYYGDSAPNRRHNVELAVQRVNGALVPPGAVFSFNQTVGPINLATGYKVGYGIVATNGRVQTVPSVGGGVCQVSTTLFHAAFWGGFPIVERNWHLYWIPIYGQPPSGLIGLDATVDTDYGLDFKFRNTTDDWIAIVAWADGSWVRFEIWGTKPNWRVEVDEPIVTNVVPADPTPVFRESSDLAPGEQVVIERARDGFTVTIRRRVYSGDRLIDDLTLRATYQPSQNVTLVGPQPSPTPTVSPAPDDQLGSPTPEQPAPEEGEATPVPTPQP